VLGLVSSVLRQEIVWEEHLWNDRLGHKTLTQSINHGQTDDTDAVYVFVEAHLTVLVLDVTVMKLRDFRKDIDIFDDQLYQRCLHDDIVSIEV